MSGSRPWRQQQHPRVAPDDVKFAEFTGVVNTRSRKDIGLKALYAGDNVFISDSKKVTRRDGYSLARGSGTVKSAYGGTGELYVVEAGSLIHVMPTEDRVLTTGLTSGAYVWDTINNDAYFVNGVDAGIARGNTYLPWRLTPPQLTNAVALGATALAASFNTGETYTAATFRILATYITADGRETAPSETLTLVASPTTNLIRVTIPAGYARTNVYCTEPDGTSYRLVASTTTTTVTFNPQRGGEEFTSLGMSCLPDGITHIAFFKGLCFAAQYLPALRSSVVWVSQPFAYHLFDMEKDFHPVSGQVALLLWNNEGVLIGTTEAIYQWHDKTGELELLVNYGVLPGVAGDVTAESKAYFWTQRGICECWPFKNLTEDDVGMAPGARAVGSLLYLNGMQQFVTVTQGGGTPFNSRKERT